MPLTDSVFLLAESREHPMHVGGLQLYTLPDGAGPDFVSNQYRRLVDGKNVRRLFRRRPRGPVSLFGQWSWAEDEQIDLDYHVRLSALPRPGRVRELLELTSRLHGTLLDRHRPLWEFHLIEGLEGGRFATYGKLHHALADGVSAMRLLLRTLSEDPAAVDLPPPWAGWSRPPCERSQPNGSELNGGQPNGTAPANGLNGSGGHGGLGGLGAGLGAMLDVPRRAVGGTARTIGELAGVGPALFGVVQHALLDHGATLPFQAPRSMLNVPITGGRRFAAQSWPMARVKAVRRATRGSTVNDVVMAMCAGALRHYLLDLGALPDRPLVAMVPLALRTRSTDGEPGGNAVGTILASLATNVADPAERFRQIRASLEQGKQAMNGLSPLQILALSAMVMAPLAANPLPGVVRVAPPPFNLVISNVPGPRRPLYWEGARLEGLYPLSIPYDGQALNITVTSYLDSLDFGLTGCRRSVPHLQRLLTHLETALAELETAATAT
ncbi:MAG TPA: wax ester/triacylglycerol synthase family O-acyltransferase [Mycobacteriales bacterium]|nr:wax ester/triacylglycerol synthase family O-acyltransferase [Mycobacteriales bacterium]